MKKKRVLALLLVAALLAATMTAMTGCSSDDTGGDAETPGQTGDLLARIQDAGKITIAMEGTWSPWTYHNEDGDLVGFDVEVGAAIAEKLGVEPVYEEGVWDGLLAGVDAGRYDMMINGIDYTEERAETYALSDPYCYNRTAVIVRTDDDSITKMEDLAGKTTANTISSTYAQVGEKYGATVTGVDDFNQTIELLLQGRIDATINAEQSYLDYVREHPDAPVKIACYDYETTNVVIAVKKGDDAASLLDAINSAIAELREDGTLSRLSETYFGTDITSDAS